MTSFSQGHCNGSSFNPGDYFAPPNPKTSCSLATTVEVNQWQKDTEFKEGSHLTFDFGGSYVLNNKGDEVGVFGHYVKQISDDKGDDVGSPADRVAGIGSFYSYWIKPMKIGLMGRITHNFAAKNRFAGTAAQMGFNFLILADH